MDSKGNETGGYQIQKGYTEKVKKIKDIDTDVYEVEFEGQKAVVKEYQSRNFLKFYSLSSYTPALPRVLAVFENANASCVNIVMEKLEEFKYDSSKRQQYFAAIEMIYWVSEKSDLDISPANTMMRSDGQIVFIDLWTEGSWTPIYYCKRDNPMEGITKSLACVLVFYEKRHIFIEFHRRAIKRLCEIFIDNTHCDICTSLRLDDYDKSIPDADVHLFRCLRVYCALNRAEEIERKMKALNDTVKNYAEALKKRNWEFIEKVGLAKGSSKPVAQLLPEFLKSVGLSDEEVAYFC